MKNPASSGLALRIHPRSISQTLRRLPRGLTLIVALGLSLLPARADTVVLIPDADATLIEAAPSNNLGGALWFTAGTTQAFTRNRGLVRFDITNGIPRGAKITLASMIVSVTRPLNPRERDPGTTYTFHRMFRPWGEGAGVGIEGSPGLGREALPGEVTWYQPFYGTTNFWSSPGAAAGTDFSTTVSALNQIAIVTTGGYEIEATPQLAADIQFWLDHPESNFGWLVKTTTEDSNFTAHGFGSRETADLENGEFGSALLLTIDYIPALVISSARKSGASFQFTFNADAGPSYVVETLGALSSSNAWVTATNYGVVNASTNITFITPATNGVRFFRVRRD